MIKTQKNKRKIGIKRKTGTAGKKNTLFILKKDKEKLKVRGKNSGKNPGKSEKKSEKSETEIEFRRILQLNFLKNFEN